VSQPGERHTICSFNTRSWWPTAYHPGKNSLYVPYIDNCLDMTSAAPAADGKPAVLERRVGTPRPGADPNNLNGLAKVNVSTGEVQRWVLGKVPTNGAVLAGAYQGYTMPAPVNSFTTITLPVPIVVNGPGDVVIALTNPAPSIGTRPASADSGPFVGRSWVAHYDDIGEVPDLSAVGLLPNPVALAGFNGNWLIRATGTNASGQPIVLGMPEQN